MAESIRHNYILILHTTLYRTGGVRFKRVAETMAREKALEFPAHALVSKAVESKQAFLDAIESVKLANGRISELHFIGHSGVYGIMFGTTKWPEQFSPHEWRELRAAQLPFATDAHLYFHACRSARWFAPFIARTLGVATSGNYWYTTFSRSPRVFKWESGSAESSRSLYVMSCPGKKSHGAFASLIKYAGFTRAIPMLQFSPSDEKVDTSYDSVASLYDDTFDDIAVRKDEWAWLTRSLGNAEQKRVLDIGCGNGAFLQKLSPRILEGVGVDISNGMLEQARKRCAAQKHLLFAKLDGPQLPFADNSFDVVMSVLSFRYLDWDPILQEILRVMKPGGQFLVIDMVAAPVKMREIPFFVKAKFEVIWQRIFQKRYWRALRTMVTDQRWKTMLKYNPMRSEHEMKWYLESRFSGNKVDVINVGWNSRVIAFGTGPVHLKEVEKLAYP